MISVGAKVLLDLNRQQAVKQVGVPTRDEGTEEEGEESDFGEEAEGSSAEQETGAVERISGLQGKVDKLRKSLINETTRFVATRQTLGWLRAEQALLSTAKRDRSRASNRKQNKRRKLLRQRIPGLKFTQRSLRKHVEKFSCLVKIKRKQKDRNWREQLRP